MLDLPCSDKKKIFFKIFSFPHKINTSHDCTFKQLQQDTSFSGGGDPILTADNLKFTSNLLQVHSKGNTLLMASPHPIYTLLDRKINMEKANKC